VRAAEHRDPAPPAMVQVYQAWSLAAALQLRDRLAAAGGVPRTETGG
jgi:hypothetical protein